MVRGHDADRWAFVQNLLVLLLLQGNETGRFLFPKTFFFPQPP
jgi:hypothetical protein